MMKCYRIYTEATGHYRQRAIEQTAKRFDGFTVIDCVGFWEGAAESALIIEIVTESSFLQVKTLARRIKAINHQYTVLVTTQDIEGSFI